MLLPLLCNPLEYTKLQPYKVVIIGIAPYRGNIEV